VAAVPAARTVLRLVKYLATQTGPIHAATVARDLGLPRSTTYQLLRALQDEGFLVHFPEERAYALSSLLGELGSTTDRAARLRRLGTPLLARLVTSTGLPVVAQLGLLHGTDVVYAAKESAYRAPTTVTAIGVRMPAHLTATGRAMLAALDHVQLRALYPDRAALVTRVPAGSAGPTTLRELDEVLRTTTERGWAIEREEVTPGYASVAAVVRDHNAQPAAAVALTFRTVAVDASVLPSLGDAARTTAESLSQRLRGRA
jgi:DNA-binding IclR family transcriptional regulator